MSDGAEVFEIYNLGIVHASVCSTLPLAEVTERLNREHPTGLKSGGWKPSKDKTFKGGEPNPCPCNRGGPALHYLFVC